MTVSDASQLQRRWFAGRAKGTQEIDLSFRVAGTLVERDADIGAEIEEGTVIARIDPATYQADVDRSKADLLRAEATLKNAKDQLNRAQILVDKGHLAPAALDRQLAAQREAEADVVARKAALKRRRLDLGYTVLKAPFSGIVVTTFVENFQDVSAQQPVVRLVDSSQVEMIVDIPENLISQTHTVKEVMVRFDALPDVDIPATIKEVGTEATQATRTYPVTLIMDQPADNKILPGMAGKATAVRIESDEETGLRIIVPETAVLTKEDAAKTFVWVIDGNAETVAIREVQIGSLGNQGLEIVDGLQPGERIVTAGVNYLKEGQKVRLLK